MTNSGPVAPLSGGMRNKKKKDFLTSLVPIKPVQKIVVAPEDSSVCLLQDKEEDFASSIFPWLFLGGAHDAERVHELRTHQVTHVINLSPESKIPVCEGIRYLHVNVGDHSDQPIHEHFESTISFIDEARQHGKVLVHCRHGISRSATIVIAYLIKKMCIPVILAKGIVKQLRPVINPNLGFVDALCTFQRQEGVDLSLPLSSYRTTLESWSFSCSVLESYAGDRQGASSPQSTPLSSPPSPQGILCF